jgi:hypothetical protein
MRWPVVVWQLAERFGIDPSLVARWPKRKIDGGIAYSEWQALQEDRALKRAKEDADIEAARAEAASKSGKKPPVPKRR